MRILAITGHRPPKIGGYDPASFLRQAVIASLRVQIQILKPDILITGMALGVDQDAAEAAIEFGIPFWAAIPCEGQESQWPKPSRQHYRDLLAHAALVHVVTSGPFTHACMQRRNEWMVDHADHLLAVWDGTSGGTANCVRYAMDRIPITAINPSHLF